MALSTAETKYTFRFVQERQIHEYFDNHGTAGLRALVDAVEADREALERLADAIDSGESYSVDPDAVRSWWGWG